MLIPAIKCTKMMELAECLSTELEIDIDLAHTVAVGAMEKLWAYTANQFPQGNIGKMPNKWIAREAGIPTSHAEWFVQTLVTIKFLDSDADIESGGNRLIVHDWSEHTHDFVHQRLARNIELFADGRSPKMNRLTFNSREKLELEYKQKYGDDVFKRSRSAQEALSKRSVSAQIAPREEKRREEKPREEKRSLEKSKKELQGSSLRSDPSLQTSFAGDDLQSGEVSIEAILDSIPDPPTELQPEQPTPKNPPQKKRQFEATEEEWAVAGHWHSEREHWAAEHAPGAYLPPGTIPVKDLEAVRTLLNGLKKRAPTREPPEHARDLITWLHRIEDFWPTVINTLPALVRKLPDGKYYAKYAAWRQSGGGNGRCGTHRPVETRPEERHRAQFYGGVKQ